MRIPIQKRSVWDASLRHQARLKRSRKLVKATSVNWPVMLAGITATFRRRIGRTPSPFRSRYLQQNPSFRCDGRFRRYAFVNGKGNAL